MSQDQITQQAAAAVTANNPAVVNLANAVTGVYGISGSGKSSLVDTAIEYAWRKHRALSLVYCADLGGFGTNRIALIRMGIAYCWDPRNRDESFATTQALSLGAFPASLLPGGSATMEQREKGYAPPDEPLVYPTAERHWFVCPQGHRVGRFDSVIALQTATVSCPTCGHACRVSDPAVRVGSGTVTDPRFAHVGHRAYDSMTALNDWGLQKLPEMSARGLVGKVLNSADAVREGDFVFGTGSESQVGFMQNRTQEWIGNIRSIAGQKIPPTMTFGVEMSKADNTTGGQIILGPNIAGKARTGAVGYWLGNLGHVERSNTPDGRPLHRLWLVNHYDPMDPRRVPYIAKHRGNPIGMPMYLEDPPLVNEQGVYDPSKAWSVCSLGVLYDLLDQQAQTLTTDMAARYPDAPAFKALPAAVETIVESHQPTANPILPAVPEGVVQAQPLGPGYRRLPRGAQPPPVVGSAPPVPIAETALAAGAPGISAPPMVGVLPAPPTAVTAPAPSQPAAGVASTPGPTGAVTPAAPPAPIGGPSGIFPTPAPTQPPLPPQAAPPPLGVPPGPRTRVPRPPAK